MKWESLRFRSKRELAAFLVLVIFLVGILMVLTTPLHETLHVVMCTIEPWVEIHEVYLLGVPETVNGHALPSMFGCVVAKPTYHGALADRPAYADLLQEIICLSVQILLTVYLTLKISIFVCTHDIKLCFLGKAWPCVS